MKHLFLDYELALEAKELGFRESCMAWYSGSTPGHFYYHDGSPEDNNAPITSEEIERLSKLLGKDHRECEEEIRLCCSAPLYIQIVDWLRESHNISIDITTSCNSKGFMYYITIHSIIDDHYRAESITIGGDSIIHWHPKSFDNYYNTLKEGIKEAFKLVKSHEQ